jgi:hypothetical protein
MTPNESIWFKQDGEFLEIKLFNGVVVRGLAFTIGLDRSRAIEKMRQYGWDVDE